MNSFAAMIMGDSARAAGAKQMIFDWHKAAKLIRERTPQQASAGLANDWEYTGGRIYTASEGPLKKDDSYTYLSSNWATPELDLDGDIVSCYILEDENPNGWDSSTFWPSSALEILK